MKNNMSLQPIEKFHTGIMGDKTEQKINELIEVVNEQFEKMEIIEQLLKDHINKTTIFKDTPYDL